MDRIKQKTNICISMLLAAVMLLSVVLMNGSFAGAAEGTKVQQIHNEMIARGIYFQQNTYENYLGIPGKRQSEYIITADLKDESVQILSAKANDKILKLSTVSSQIAGEQVKGQNIVAGINGDMFNISLGTEHYGAPQGLQVQDGKILTGFETIGSGPRYPVFAIDKNQKPLITYLAMDNHLSVVDAQYERVYGSANPDLTIAIDTINRNNTQVMNDKMILITPQLDDNAVIGFTEEQAANGTFTVLKKTDDPGDPSIKLGQVYEAEVVSIQDTAKGAKSMVIPADGMVLASQGLKATWMKAHLKAGDRVRFSFNLKDLNGNVLELEQAVTAWLPLVENGQALTKEDMLEICKNDWDLGRETISAADKARTAIGFTRDHKVMAVVVDQAGSNSSGTDLPGIAQRMQELGVIAAVSLDGGGSTQMNTRLLGENKVQLINQPADGKERPVSNTILFASNAPAANDVNKLKVNKDITLFKNTSFAFQVRGQDSNGNPVDLSEADIKWNIQPYGNTYSQNRHGTIDPHGLFTAGRSPGELTVSASLNDVTSTALITVVDAVDTLTFAESGMIAVQPGVARQLKLNAYAQDGQPVLIYNDTAEWSVTPSSIAAIDKQGVLTPLSKGNGVIRARIGGIEAHIEFVSGLEAQLIDSYENLETPSYFIDGYVGGSCEISAEQVKEGQYSLKVDYDYGTWGKVYNGTINVHVQTDIEAPGYISNIRPKRIGMWVYGDGNAPWLRAIVKDGDDNAHTVNFVSRIDWVGWQYVTAEIPADIPVPVTLDYFYMVETDKSKNLQGTVYFDDVRYLYLES